MKLLRSMTLVAVLFAAPAARASGFVAAIPSTGDGEETVLQTKVAPMDCAVDGAAGPRTREALRAFQRESGLEATGALDAATQAKLQAMVHALALVRGSAEVVEVQGDESAVDALGAAAALDGESTRLAAIGLLADLRTARSRAVLGIAMHGNTLASVRIAATRELARYGDEPSLFAIALAAESERDLLVASVMQDTLDAVIAAEVPPVAVELLSDAR